MNEAAICSAIARQVLLRKCIVLVDHCSWAGDEADLLGVTMDRRMIDIEVKVSRADFRIDAKKDKWWLFKGWNRETRESIREHRDWPNGVWKHYYAMPAAIWKPEMESQRGSQKSGVILLKEREDGSVWPIVAHRAMPNPKAERLTENAVLDIARLANLRMWDAYLGRSTARDPVAA